MAIHKSTQVDLVVRKWIATPLAWLAMTERVFSVKMDSRSEVTFRADDSKACKSLVASENALKTLSSSLGCAEGLR